MHPCRCALFMSVLAAILVLASACSPTSCARSTPLPQTAAPCLCEACGHVCAVVAYQYICNDASSDQSQCFMLCGVCDAAQGLWPATLRTRFPSASWDGLLTPGLCSSRFPMSRYLQSVVRLGIYLVGRLDYTTARSNTLLKCGALCTPACRCSQVKPWLI